MHKFYTGEKIYSPARKENMEIIEIVEGFSTIAEENIIMYDCRSLTDGKRYIFHRIEIMSMLQHDKLFGLVNK